VQLAERGDTALELLSEGPSDVVVLDLSVRDMRGIDLLREIRAASDVPVVVLTARCSIGDKVRLLEAGADDYVTMPLAMEELVRRMQATVRRTDGDGDRRVRAGGIVVDLERRAVTRAGEPVHLTPTEYRLLAAMAGHPGKLLTHRWLVSTVWGPGYGSESQNLRVYVRQLRKKLEDDPARPRLIVTEPALGYRWAADMLAGGATEHREGERGDEPEDGAQRGGGAGP
jgi:two-component system KDP operon response regulator KdpE